MLRVTLRSFWEHKRRLISTIVAIVLGVAFMAGTFVLTDTLDKVFDDLFAEGNANVDAQVQGPVLFSDPFSGGDQRELLDASLVDTVAAVPEVDEAVPYVLTLGFGSNNRVRRQRRRADRRVPGAPDADRELGRLRPVALRGGGRPRPGGRRRDGAERGRRRRRRLRGGRHRHPGHPARAQGVHPRRDGPLRHRGELGRGRVGGAHPGRGAAHRGHRGPDPERPGRSPGGCQPGRAGRGHRARADRRRRGPDGRGGGGPALVRRAGGVRVLPAGPDDLRDHRPRRRHLRHLQHVRDPPRPADARAGAAAGGRREPRAGAGLGDAGGGPRRAGRPPCSACSPASAWPSW